MSNSTSCSCNPNPSGNTASDTDSFGTTLTGGIQDVAAFLPIIGTDQCEGHVGSALDKGYLHASATILSIFGSLGILKNALSVLFASSKLFWPSWRKHPPHKWPSLSWDLYLGAAAIDNAGFAPAGSVAALIALEEDGNKADNGKQKKDENGKDEDGKREKRYAAETNLIELLKEKHIDNPGKVIIQSTPFWWNFGLVVSALLAGGASLAPYFYPISTLRVQISPSPWLYPTLRSGGSVVACLTIQFILQHRILSLMKSRLIFMTLDQSLALNTPGTLKDLSHNKSKSDSRTGNTSGNTAHWQEASNPQLGDGQPAVPPAGPGQTADQLAQDVDHDSQSAGTGDKAWKIKQEILEKMWWSDALPAEWCLWKLEQSFKSHNEYAELRLPDGDSLGNKFDAAWKKHFSSSHCSLFPLWWILLLISAVSLSIGYVGCFTLISDTPADSKAPLAWLGAECGLAVLRLIIWAMDPDFDSCTQVSMQLELSNNHPLVTTQKSMKVLKSHDAVTLLLMPEKDFLQWITPYTGPLDRFEPSENMILYFTLVGNFTAQHLPTGSPSPERNTSINNEKQIADGDGGNSQKVLYMTLWDMEKQSGMTMVIESQAGPESSITYYDASVRFDPSCDHMVAVLNSKLKEIDFCRAHHQSLCDALEHHYRSWLTSLFLTQPEVDHKDSSSATATQLDSRGNFGASQSTSAPVRSVFAKCSGVLRRSMQVFTPRPRLSDPESNNLNKSISTSQCSDKECDTSGSNVDRPAENPPPSREPSATESSPVHSPTHAKQEGTDPSQRPIAPLLVTWNLQNMWPHKKTPELPRPHSLLTPNDQNCLALGDRHRFKTDLIPMWERWILKAWHTMRAEIEMDDYFNVPKLKHRGQKKLLSDRDICFQAESYLFIQFTLRELDLVQSSMRLEDLFVQQREEAWKDFSSGQKFWLLSQFSGLKQARRADETRRQGERLKMVKERVTTSFKERIPDYDPNERDKLDWKTFEKMIDDAWAKPEGIQSSMNALKSGLEDAKNLEDTYHWTATLHNEMVKMAEVINEVKSKSSNACQYPAPHREVWTRFSRAGLEDQNYIDQQIGSATVIHIGNLKDWSIEMAEIIAKPSTRYVLGIPLMYAGKIVPNDHLLYLADRDGREIELEWIKENRKELLASDTRNRFTFYFLPEFVALDGHAIGRNNGTIAHLTVLVGQRSRLRIWLLHSGCLTRSVDSVRITYGGKGLDILPEVIPNDEKDKCKWKSFDLEGEFEGPSRVETRIDVHCGDKRTAYYLRDIFVEFLTPQAGQASVRLIGADRIH